VRLVNLLTQLFFLHLTVDHGVPELFVGALVEPHRLVELLLEHVLSLLAEVDLIRQVVGLGLQLLDLLFHALNLGFHFADLVLLLRHLLAMRLAHACNIGLPLLVLSQRVFYRQILDVDQLEGVLNELFDQELAVTKLAALAPGGTLRQLHKRDRSLWVLPKQSRLPQAVLAVADSAEFAVRVDQVTLLLPFDAARVAAFL